MGHNSEIARQSAEIEFLSKEENQPEYEQRIIFVDRKTQSKKIEGKDKLSLRETCYKEWASSVGEMFNLDLAISELLIKRRIAKKKSEEARKKVMQYRRNF